jgi:KaiC/GvpD/RAD55 family RecA-like ATPase
VSELDTLKFIPRNQIALLLGPPGTGKTHVALAIGILAIKQGHRVYCSSLKRVIKEITTHKAKNTLDLLFKKILSAHLWIIDGWGVVSITGQLWSANVSTESSAAKIVVELIKKSPSNIVFITFCSMTVRKNYLELCLL